MIVAIFNVNFDEVVRLGGGADLFNGEEVGIGLGSGNGRLFIGIGDSKTFDLGFFFILNSNGIRFLDLIDFP